ncbi:DEAD/DEAH box helicase, partial [Rhodococcus sp. YH1]|uniref:DEAD/DEAH box helicase n=1 Tax=Rhodococcus sp. YH1 TaxID=89066 RepID=UPI001EE3B661
MTVSFSDLGVPRTLVASLGDSGITSPFPIQVDTLPDTLAGRDVLGRGRTGSGKTLAFSIPLAARLAGRATREAGRPRGLVLAPTRELATQIAAVVNHRNSRHGQQPATTVVVPRIAPTISAGSSRAGGSARR